MNRNQAWFLFVFERVIYTWPCPEILVQSLHAFTKSVTKSLTKSSQPQCLDFDEGLSHHEQLVLNPAAIIPVGEKLGKTGWSLWKTGWSLSPIHSLSWKSKIGLCHLFSLPEIQNRSLSPIHHLFSYLFALFLRIVFLVGP